MGSAFENAIARVIGFPEKEVSAAPTSQGIPLQLTSTWNLFPTVKDAKSSLTLMSAVACPRWEYWHCCAVNFMLADSQEQVQTRRRGGMYSPSCRMDVGSDPRSQAAAPAGRGEGGEIETVSHTTPQQASVLVPHL
jgi:hypothetical protein